MEIAQWESDLLQFHFFEVGKSKQGGLEIFLQMIGAFKVKHTSVAAHFLDLIGQGVGVHANVGANLQNLKL